MKCTFRKKIQNNTAKEDISGTKLREKIKNRNGLQFNISRDMLLWYQTGPENSFLFMDSYFTYGKPSKSRSQFIFIRMLFKKRA
jgi:hypothetical protein